MPEWPEIVIGAKRWKLAVQVAVIALGGLVAGEMLELSGFLSGSAIGKLAAAAGSGRHRGHRDRIALFSGVTV